jgi:hypothetical protein
LDYPILQLQASVDVCAHIPLILWVSTSYVVLMKTNTLEPMMQFVTPLLPLHKMLASTRDKNNFMRFLQYIQILSLTSQHCVYQRWHSHPNRCCHC